MLPFSTLLLNFCPLLPHYILFNGYIGRAALMMMGRWDLVIIVGLAAPLSDREGKRERDGGMTASSLSSLLTQYFLFVTHLDNQTCVSALFLCLTTNHFTRKPSETERLRTSYLLEPICCGQVLVRLEKISSDSKYFQLFSQTWFRFFHEVWIISDINVGSLLYFKVANTRMSANRLHIRGCESDLSAGFGSGF